jgi:fructosamine-3-kinase
VSLPPRLRAVVERALEAEGAGSRIRRATPVAGGCSNHGTHLVTDAGAELFLKWNPSAPPGLFEAEVDGLTALARAAHTLRVPAPLAWGEGPAGSWLLLEYAAPGRATRETEEALGRGLAELHRSEVSTSSAVARSLRAGADAPAFGWHRDNWIGSLPQQNAFVASWSSFWRDRRIVPQLAQARRNGRLRRRAADEALERAIELIPVALAGVERPELVHGDFWGGNWFADEHGEPVVVDPAAYFGHGEVDLAMSELFGGFGDPFYAAYRDAHGISAAYAAYRRDLYQLYYLLVHVNLFGASYEAATLRAAQRVVAALG